MRKTYNLAILSVLAASAFATASGQQGSMHGGQAPIVGARIYVLSPAQSTTLGTASVSLLTSGDGSDQMGFYVLTGSDGYFPDLSGKYSCPTPSTPIYLYGAGGDAQTGAGPNAAISQVVYAGPCDTINSGTFLFMDEVTTVALDYAVAGYATDPLHISYSGSAASLTGIENAFANASNLANSAEGYAYRTIPSGIASAPEDTVNTIADADATCINETSQTPNTSSCAILFSAASVNGVAPTDTATAIMNIAHNPTNSTAAGKQNGTNIASIMSLASDSQQQFTPTLPTAPSDLTLGLTFINGGIANAFAVAIDRSGNAWIASQPSTNSNANSSVVEIASPTNMQLNETTYLVDYPTSSGEPYSIAVDGQSQNIWIGEASAVEEISNTGVPASGSPFLMNDPNPVTTGFYGINLDSAGNVWIAGYYSIYELSSTGSVLSPLPNGDTLPSGAAPTGIALDPSNNVWVADGLNNDLIELNSQGTQVTTIGSTNDFDEPNGVAIDANGNKWAANIGNNNFTKYSPTGAPTFTYDPADTPPPSSNVPYLTFVGIDGAGNSWLSLQGAACDGTNTVCPGVAEVSGAGTQLSGPGYAIQGFQPSQSATANSVAIDGSGDVWIANTFSQSVTELVGAAAPVVTPLALAVSSNSLGVRP